MLLSPSPLCHECIIEQYCKIAFNVFCNSDNLSQDISVNQRSIKIALKPIVLSTLYPGSRQLSAKWIVYLFHETNRKLIELKLLERLVGNALISLIHTCMKNHVIQTCNKTFDYNNSLKKDAWNKSLLILRKIISVLGIIRKYRGRPTGNCSSLLLMICTLCSRSLYLF